MSQTIEGLIADEPYTRERHAEEVSRVLARLCEKHNVTTQAEVDEIIREHRYEHTAEDPEDEYIALTTIAHYAEWA